MRKFSARAAGRSILVLAAALAMVLPASTASAQMRGMPASVAGASAPSVMAVQDALARHGFPIKVDGVLGPETRAAVKAFQTRHQLPATGEADAATLAKLGVQDGGHAAHSPSATSHAAHGRPAPQGGMAGGGMMHGSMMHGGMMKGRRMPEGMMAQCADVHQQMRQMMAQMQEMMKTMQDQMKAPKPN